MEEPRIHRFLSAKDWADFVFERPVARKHEEEWYWELDTYNLRFDTRETLRLASETFENSAEDLARFTDEQIGQGMAYIKSNSCSDQLMGLNDETIPVAERIRAVRSFVHLFRDVVAARLPQEVRQADGIDDPRLATACFMWWDSLPIHGRLELPERAELDAAVLETLREILAVPHDAVRESALHGLNEWESYYPDRVHVIIDAFIYANPGMKPELLEYARGARGGMMM